MNREESMLLGEQNQSIGHPFRQSLPIDPFQFAKANHVPEAAATSEGKGLGEDVSLFLLSFIAFFTAFYTFIF